MQSRLFADCELAGLNRRRLQFRAKQSLPERTSGWRACQALDLQREYAQSNDFPAAKVQLLLKTLGLLNSASVAVMFVVLSRQAS